MSGFTLNNFQLLLRDIKLWLFGHEHSHRSFTLHYSDGKKQTFGHSRLRMFFRFRLDR